MAAHPVPLAHTDQDVHAQWRMGAIRGLSQTAVEEARRRQLKDNTQLLDVLKQFRHAGDQGPLPRGWYTVTRGAHSRDIHEPIGDLFKQALVCLLPAHKAASGDTLALQVTYPREAQLPTTDLDWMAMRDNLDPRSGKPVGGVPGGLAYIPPPPEAQAQVRFPYRLVTVSTFARRYKWAIAGTHRLSPMLFTLAMSEVLNVPLEHVAITVAKNPSARGMDSPYELFCVVQRPTVGPYPSRFDRMFHPAGSNACPICGSVQALDRTHMNQDTHRFGMVMLMDGMSLIVTSREAEVMSFFTFELIHEEQLGKVRLHQAAATHTDANVHNEAECIMHLRRLKAVSNALEVEDEGVDTSEDHASQSRDRARIKLMYFAMLRHLDDTKLDTAKMQQRFLDEMNKCGSADYSEHQPRLPLTRMEHHLIRFTQQSIGIFLRMAVRRRRSVIRHLTIVKNSAEGGADTDEVNAQLMAAAGSIPQEEMRETAMRVRAIDWQPLGVMLTDEAPWRWIRIPAAMNTDEFLGHLRAQRGTPHPPRWLETDRTLPGWRPRTRGHEEGGALLD